MSRRIALLSEPLLSSRYGKGGLAIIHALEGLDETRVVVSKGSSADQIRRDLQTALTEEPDSPLLLVGGVSTLPFFELPMDPPTDQDQEVLSDNPYGTPGDTTDLGEVALPARAIGRIPDHPGDDARSFADRIRALCRPGPASAEAGTFYVLGAKVWQKTTASISAGLDRAIRPDVAPPRSPADFTKASFISAQARRHLFNLHGSDREVGWFGQEGRVYPVAIDPPAIAALGPRLRDSLVVSQACYGGFLLFPGGPRKVGESCCLQFLERGAAGFVGATTIAYGGVDGEMNCSDVIALEFLMAASAGVPLGESLRRARNTLAAAVRSPPAGTQLKTLLQFVLYGDPARVWIPPSPVPKAMAVSSAAPPAVDPSRLAQYTRWSEESVPAPKSMMSTAQDPDGWVVQRAFSSGASRGAKAGPLAGAAPRAHRQLLRSDRQLGQTVAYFQERITYDDGSSFRAESTGGRSLLTLEEQARGAERWWRQPAPPRRTPAKRTPRTSGSPGPAEPHPRKSPTPQRKAGVGRGATKKAGARRSMRRKPVKK